MESVESRLLMAVMPVGLTPVSMTLLAGSADISGTVINDVNGNGVKDTGETTGISGVTITAYNDVNSNGAYDSGTDTVAATTTTNSSGAWSFSLGKNKPYLIVETNPSGYRSTNAVAGTGSGTVTKKTNDQINFSTSSSGGSITGCVFLDSTTTSATTLSSSLLTSTYGLTVTFTAAVTASSGSPTGTVTFKDGAATLGTGTLSAGVATFTTNLLAAGSHTMTAVYGGDASFTSSTSPAITETVKKAPLTVTADGATKFFLEANPAFTAQYSGFVLGEDASALGGALNFATPATTFSLPGSYSIAPGGLTSSNYDITYVDGTLTVTYLLGDVNHDGKLDSADLNAILANYGQSSGSQWKLVADGLAVGKADLDFALSNVFHTRYGDTNLDGRVDEDDFQSLLDNWQGSDVGIGWGQGDFNGDGIVDFLDFQTFLDHYDHRIMR